MPCIGLLFGVAGLIAEPALQNYAEYHDIPVIPVAVRKLFHHIPQLAIASIGVGVGISSFLFFLLSDTGATDGDDGGASDLADRLSSISSGESVTRGTEDAGCMSR